MESSKGCAPGWRTPLTTDFGGYCVRVTPVPIPNTEVKPNCADGTWVDSPWESRSPPDFSKWTLLWRGPFHVFAVGRALPAAWWVGDAASVPMKAATRRIVRLSLMSSSSRPDRGSSSGRSGAGARGSGPSGPGSSRGGSRGPSGGPSRGGGATAAGRSGQGSGRSGGVRSEGERSGRGFTSSSDRSRAPKRSGGRPDSTTRSGGQRNIGGRGSSSSRGGSARDDSVDSRGRDVAGPKSWGSLGRRGAGRLGEGRVDSRDAAGAQGRDDRPDPGNKPVVWQRVDDSSVRDEANGAVGRGREAAGRGSRSGGAPASERSRSTRSESSRSSSAGKRTSRPPRANVPEGLEPKKRRGRARRTPGSGTGAASARDELVRALGNSRGEKANDRLRDAAHAFERERYEEARSLLRPIAEAAPQATAVRELLGLTYYRLGKWNEALRELSVFREQSGSTEQHPVLADCNRALKRHLEVEALWDELRDSSPSPDLVAEGRIVMAGSLADRGRLAEAIDLLERSHRSVKRVQIHHLRQAYVLADLYEQAGDLARAREMFRWIVASDAGFADAAERAGSIA